MRRYGIEIRVEPDSIEGTSVPVTIDVDFSSILSDMGEQKRFDTYPVEVVDDAGTLLPSNVFDIVGKHRVAWVA